MKRISIYTKDLPPHIREAVGAKTTTVTLTETVFVDSLQWSGGTRYTYTIMNLDDPSIIKPITDVRRWPDNMAPLGEVPLPERFVMVKGGVFCGKNMTPTLYARSSDVVRAIDKPTPELSHVEKQVLKCLSIYNSSGRKRFRDDFNMTKEQWDRILVSLVSKGLATKQGSATPEGRNAASSISDLITNPYSADSKEEAR